MVTSKTTDSKGKVVLTVVPGKKKGQKEQYELIFAGSATNKASHGSVITLTVSWTPRRRGRFDVVKAPDRPSEGPGGRSGGRVNAGP